MRAKILEFFLVFSLSVLAWHSAFADCVASGDGTLTASGASVSICKADAERVIFNVIGLGFCEDLPDVSANPDALSQCTNILSSPVDVDLQIGTTQSVPMVTPKPGTYGYTYRLSKVLTKFSAVFRFSNDMIGGSGANIPFNYSDPTTYTIGKYCQPPSFAYDTGLFTGVIPSRCTSTPPVSLTLANLNFNNFGSSEWEPVASVFLSDVTNVAYVTNPAADQNMFLLDADMKLATSKESVVYGLLVTKNNTPIVVSDSVAQVNVQFGLTDALDAKVQCIVGFPDCFFIIPYINGQLINMTVVNSPNSGTVASYQ